MSSRKRSDCQTQTQRNAALRKGESAPLARPIVVLFDDCFTTYNEPHIGQAAVQLLERFGYDVQLANSGCCGRAMISTGLLDDAVSMIDRTLTLLQPAIEDPNVKAILVLEPSCLSAMLDDWLQLKLSSPIDLRKRVAAKAMAVEDFLERRWCEHPSRPEVATSTPPQESGATTSVLYHGHCHQKALWGHESSAALLSRLGGNSQTVRVLDSGCCGMAGSFGYLAKRYDLSMRIGEQSVFPPIRAAGDGATLCAPGTSCRHQIADGTGRRAKHPVESRGI